MNGKGPRILPRADVLLFNVRSNGMYSKYNFDPWVTMDAWWVPSDASCCTYITFKVKIP